jgi:hypothetical protein
MRSDCEYVVHLVQQFMIPGVKVTQKYKRFEVLTAVLLKTASSEMSHCVVSSNEPVSHPRRL